MSFDYSALRSGWRFGGSRWDCRNADLSASVEMTKFTLCSFAMQNLNLRFDCYDKCCATRPGAPHLAFKMWGFAEALSLYLGIPLLRRVEWILRFGHPDRVENLGNLLFTQQVL